MFLCDILVEQQETVDQQDTSEDRISQDSSTDQQTPPQQELDSDPDIDEDLEDGSTENDECVPIKRYYLLNKLKNFKYILKKYNIINSDFELLLKFVDSLSYNTLLFVSDKMIQSAEEQIARTRNAEEIHL
jgi:hemolysin activation/secretion protein